MYTEEERPGMDAAPPDRVFLIRPAALAPNPLRRTSTMKRIGYSVLASAAIALIAAAAFATPAPNSAIVSERVFNDCPLSTVTTLNSYPGSISIEDAMHPACVGNANLHSW